MFELKPITASGIGAALEKAERYRLLNDPVAAESICLDVLEIQPENQEALVSLVERARSIGLHPLVEVHDEEEVGRAIDAGATIFGVNARNLKTLEVDRGTFERVVPAIPETAVKIAESGIRGPHDLLAYAHQGATGVLVGEAVATAPDPQAAVHDLVTAGSHPSVMPQSD